MPVPPSTPDLDALLAHSGWVRSLAHSLVTDPATADDIEQQAWVTALERPPSHDRNLRSWWSSVVRSAAGKGWREQSRRREIEEELAAFGTDSGTVSPDNLAERLETFQRLAVAVSQLPEPYGAAIYLRYFEELPVREVARRQEVPVDTAQSRIQAGLKHLRASLQENLGAQWRQRCQVFTLPLSAAPWHTLGPAALITMTLKTPLGLAAIALMLFSLFAWAPWEAAEPEFLPDTIAALEPTEVGQEVAAEVAITRAVVEPPSNLQTGFSPSAAEGALVTVVDSNGGKRIPGAEVIVLDLGILPMPEEAFGDLAAFGAEQFILALGNRYFTDNNAQVRIPAPSGKLLLVGRTQTHFRLLRESSITESAVKGEDITLAIDLVETLPVKVIDQVGKPVEGAVVCLRQFDEDFMGGMVAAVTNADGLAWIKVLGGLKMAPSRPDLFVHLNILSPKPILAEFDLYNLPAEPVELVMPTTGQVELLIQDQSGAAVRGHYIAGIAALVADQHGGSELVPSIDMLGARAENGRTFFPYVALGLQLQGLAMTPDFARRDSVNNPGPQQAGETVVITITPKVEGSFIVGRVLNTEGMIAKNLSLKIDIRNQTKEYDSTRRNAIQTDAEGRFRMQIEGELEEGQTRTVTVVMHKTKRKPRRISEVDLSRSFPSGDTDLGDFIVDVPPLLLQGQVLSHVGEPVAGAAVELEYEKKSGVSFHDSSTQSGGGVVMIHAVGEGEIDWQAREDLALTTDSEGRFTIYAKADDCRYRVVANHRDHKGVGKEFEPGVTGFTVTMGATMKIAGRILLDPGIPELGIHVYLLTPRPNDPGEHFGHGVFANSRGYFEFPGQDPGTYALRIQSALLGEEFFYIPEAELLPVDGKFIFPDIDLRGRLHTIRAAIVDENGKRIPKGRISKPGQDWPSYFEYQPLILVGQSSAFDLEITAEGRRKAVLQGVTGDQQVVMHSGIPVKIVIDNIGLVPADWDIGVTVYEVNEDGSQSERRPGPLKLNSAGVGKSKFAWSGTFRMSFQIYHARNNDSIHRWVPFPGENDSLDFQILDHDEGQEVHLSIDPAKLEQALQAAREYEDP